MKPTLPAVLASLIVATGSANLAMAASGNASKVCLNLRDIQRTEIPNDQTIIFHMRDGKVWQNRLKTVCPMLKVSPYTQIIRGTDTVCSNQQFIHVIQTGNDCVLGDFTPLPNEAQR